MPGRHTNHRPFARDKPIGPEDRARLENSVFGDHVALHFQDAEGTKQALAALLRKADAQLLSDPEYRKEFGRWAGAGLFGNQWLVSKLGEVAMTRLPLADRIADAEMERLASAPLVGLISTAADSSLDQLRAGQAYMRVALMAERHDIRSQPLSVLLRLDHTRSEVGKLFGIGARQAQHVFRMGYAEPESMRTRRRSLKELTVGGP